MNSDETLSFKKLLKTDRPKTIRIRNLQIFATECLTKKKKFGSYHF